jgi:putative transposase
VRRLMRLMGLETMYPKPHLSLPGEQSIRYPYLLRGMSINRINQVWSCDITYIRLARGSVFLMAIIDWFSRFVLAWELSITLDTRFCLEALDRALEAAQPELGWAWTSIGHYLCRAFMAECEIRGSLSQRLPDGFRSKK